jgi:HEPN domain-containing protein
MRESSKAEGARWLEQGKVDLKWARHLLDQGAYYLVCFLAQQVAEKALKAFLYAQGEELVIGHSVRQLCQRAGERDPQFLDRLDAWALLDTYYIPTRYPNGLPGGIPAKVYNKAAADGALALAEAVVVQVEGWFAQALPPEGQESQD